MTVAEVRTNPELCEIEGWPSLIHTPCWDSKEVAAQPSMPSCSNSFFTSSAFTRAAAASFVTCSPELPSNWWLRKGTPLQNPGVQKHQSKPPTTGYLSNMTKSRTPVSDVEKENTQGKQCGFKMSHILGNKSIPRTMPRSKPLRLCEVHTYGGCARNTM